MWISAIGAREAVGQEHIAAITRLKGGGALTSQGRMVGIGLGTKLKIDDILSSDARSRIEISFLDGTRLTLGEKASLRMDRYVFTGSGAPGQLTAHLQGAARLTSGRLGQSVARVVLTTPFASITVRGTDFWTGPIDDAQGFFLLAGAIDVANGSGTVTLDEVGEGTSVAKAGSTPAPVERWSPEKLDRALAAVSF
jgi:hypothetical protein